MQKQSNLLVVAACCLYTLTGHPTRATEYFIAPGGSNLNQGTLASPWGTFDFAIDQIDPGDTLFVRGGNYQLGSRIQIRGNEGGTSLEPINIWAYPGETPILDFNVMPNNLWGQSGGRGIQIDEGADYLNIKGLTIQNARDNGIWSGGTTRYLRPTRDPLER